MAAITEPPTTGLLNLEKELVCFICTEILYQPLTLLDCLHTFCGSCLKEWFSHQHRKAGHSHSSSVNPYTCPTCRAPVKDAQHNAMINTLLEMFLTANPTKDRSAEEKAEMAQVYKPGDEILYRRRDRRRREEEDAATRERRSTTDGQSERSRREQQLHPASAERRHTTRPSSGRSRSRERRERSERPRESDRRERREQQPSGDGVVPPRSRTAGSSSSADLSPVSPPPSSPRHPDAVEARQRGARTVAHQASLRSLVSASESGTGTGDSLNEAQLMQEILAEGLLDGINVDELTEQEQDELSEMIAERYRQLHPERVRRAVSDETRHGNPADTTRQPEVQVEEADRRLRQSSRNGQRQQTQPSPRSTHSEIIGGTETRPPTSFPQSAAEQTLTPPHTTTHRRRASNESGRSDSSTTRTRRLSQSSGSRNAATRSAIELSERTQSVPNPSDRPRQLSNTNRSNTEPRNSPRASELWQAAGRQIASLPQLDSPNIESPRLDPARPVLPNVNPTPVPTVTSTSDPAASAPEPTTSSETALATRFEEPSIQCARCSRPNIQYEVYKHCAPCKFDLCLRCYRVGRGCNHWFGFGHAALFRFNSSRPVNRGNQAIELPHLLVGRRYKKPPTGTTLDSRAQVVTTTSDPTSRLQEGNFCDRCGGFANECFWSCDYCNDGEWGFCNNCVNINHCCSHPLLPVAHKSYDPKSTSSQQAGAATNTGPATLSPYSGTGRAPSPAQSAPSSATSANGTSPGLRADFVPLVITTNCDICARPISPEETRYHCPGHSTPSPESPDQKGDFDICSSCYLSFFKTGRMKREDGPDGWRLCLNGHRMIAVTFETDGDGGQRRVITRELVGGAKMTEADMAAWKLANSQLNSTQHVDTASSLASQGQWSWKEDASGARRVTRARTATLPHSSSNATRFPPDGGAGKNCRALWSYYPEEGDEGKGELMFPKHAEVCEVEEINEDWWFGVYAGDTGVFPSVYVRERA
ncbi:uncharacterized protein Z518_03836 [Rhinocladiella mackenziei CBS 650.93]|uniref:RING-type domain-containing protein n=1 Tax=Rhinocladiella mackenziei CBS 650.93 TaxID=1442369 RepID=A0A0D2H634_9EURO|nr:uncharacterized protein Z518_03836 [Rhinocladiella mackenziei CBS 650.93]KIX05863.1 hypothetical protein Z518_03836 [Rhinocladiella mackenziei CBS 650.93]